MIVSEELKKLAEIFPVKLYIVGGAVRDYILGYKLSDVDLSSSLTGEEVMELLKNTEYKATPHSLKLGTLGIKVGGKTMEYTAFRRDSYVGGGAHSPEKVEFHSDINDDALRRDFTVNAVYYDIKEEKIVDLLGGVSDLERKILRTTRLPEKVFEEDALRILRLVRFSAKLGFEIEENTFEEAKKRAYTLKEIAVERLREELNKILVADTENGIAEAHIKGLRLLVEIGAMEYIVPELLECIGVKQPPRHHLYDVYNHIVHTVEVAPPHLRLAALLHDIGKPRSIDERGHMTKHPIIGAPMAKEIMSRLKYSTDEIERVARLVEHHMYDIRCEKDEREVRAFILENIDIIDDLIALKKADHIAHGTMSGESPSGLKIERLKKEMEEAGIAFTLKELPIGGKELIESGVEPSRRGELLNALLEYGAVACKKLSAEECISFINSRID